jgi:hypothetical protein
MAELLKCIECNGLVSSEASSCPHCKASSYRGVKCCVCDQTMKHSQEYQIKVGSPTTFPGERESYFGGHKSCYDKVYPKSLLTIYVNTHCSLCGNILKVDAGKVFYYEKCDKCGHDLDHLKELSGKYDYYNSCYYCHLRLIKSSEIKFQLYNRSGLSQDYYAHKECFTASRAEKVRRNKLDEEKRKLDEGEYLAEKWKKEREQKRKLEISNFWFNDGGSAIWGVILWAGLGFLFQYVFWLSVICYIVALFWFISICAHIS